MRALAAVCAIGICGCATHNWRHTSPWNFPTAAEWNRPLEFSWENAVDRYRELTSPKGRVYDALTRTTAPDFGSELKKLEP
jgi:hypothetical protein